jgi:hypothetical protein
MDADDVLQLPSIDLNVNVMKTPAPTYVRSERVFFLLLEWSLGDLAPPQSTPHRPSVLSTYVHNVCRCRWTCSPLVDQSLNHPVQMTNFLLLFFSFSSQSWPGCVPVTQVLRLSLPMTYEREREWEQILRLAASQPHGRRKGRRHA